MKAGEVVEWRSGEVVGATKERNVSDEVQVGMVSEEAMAVRAELPKTSPTMATVGRVLLAFCPGQWDGPQPAIVSADAVSRGVAVRGVAADGESTAELQMQACNANVLVDAARFPAVLAFWRGRAAGNTLTVLPVFDKLTDAERALVAARLAERTDQPVCWAEWPR